MALEIAQTMSRTRRTKTPAGNGSRRDRAERPGRRRALSLSATLEGR